MSARRILWFVSGTTLAAISGLFLWFGLLLPNSYLPNTGVTPWPPAGTETASLSSHFFVSLGYYGAIFVVIIAVTLVIDLFLVHRARRS